MATITAPTPPVVAKAAPSQGTPSVATPSCVVAPAGVPQRQFTVDEYHRLIADGYFAHDEGFELLEGLIVRKMSRDPLHDSSLSSARRVLDARMPVGWHLRVQSAVTTIDSEPEPDIAIVQGGDFTYRTRHPGAADAVLLVEVANTSLTDDRAWKGAIYARAGFAVYWIINLNNARVEVYTDPSGPDPAPAYRRREEFGRSDSIPLTIGGIVVQPVPVADLLPPLSPP
jgi:Uma2 family endonuclease